MLMISAFGKVDRMLNNWHTIVRYLWPTSISRMVSLVSKSLPSNMQQIFIKNRKPELVNVFFNAKKILIHKEYKKMTCHSKFNKRCSVSWVHHLLSCTDHQGVTLITDCGPGLWTDTPNTFMFSIWWPQKLFTSRSIALARASYLTYFVPVWAQCWTVYCCLCSACWFLQPCASHPLMHAWTIQPISQYLHRWVYVNHKRRVRCSHRTY